MRVRFPPGALIFSLEISLRFCHDFTYRSYPVRNTSKQSSRRCCIRYNPYMPQLTRSRCHIDNLCDLCFSCMPTIIKCLKSDFTRSKYSCQGARGKDQRLSSLYHQFRRESLSFLLLLKCLIIRFFLFV